LNKNACYDFKSIFDKRGSDGSKSPFGTTTGRFWRPLELSKFIFSKILDTQKLQEKP
jgi:hypothetical protein